jgi:hypothetical protein
MPGLRERAPFGRHLIATNYNDRYKNGTENASNNSDRGRIHQSTFFF